MKAWVLTPGTLDRMLDWIDSEGHCASQKYESIRMRLIQIFLNRGFTVSEAEDLTDETIDRTIRKLRDLDFAYAGDQDSVFYSVSHKVYLEYQRKFETGPGSADPSPLNPATQKAIPPRPPFNAEYILHILLRREEREFVIGDLIEGYGEVLERFNKRRADIWFYKQVIGSLLPLVRRQILRIGALIWLGRILRQLIS